MYAALVAGFFFLAAAVLSLLSPQPDLTEALAGVIIAAILFALFAFFKYDDKRDTEFDVWLIRHAREILGGGALFRGELVTPSSVLAKYQVVVSVGIMSFRLPTASYVVDHDRTTLVGAASTVFSLVLGWWGVPWGPIWTVQAVYRNLRGGFRETVGAQLAHLPPFAHVR